jgi:hypothetical protein
MTDVGRRGRGSSGERGAAGDRVANKGQASRQDRRACLRGDTLIT